MHQFKKYTSSIFLGLTIKKCESLLQVYFWVRKEIQIHFKNSFKIYLKYASLLNFWWTKCLLETYKSKLFFNYFHKFTNFGSQNISKSILEVYFIFRGTEVYLKYSSISAGGNAIRSLHNLWSNGVVLKEQVYQTKDPRFKTIRWLKNSLSISSFKGQSNEHQGFLGT